jgi:hypothetical protein
MSTSDDLPRYPQEPAGGQPPGLGQPASWQQPVSGEAPGAPAGYGVTETERNWAIAAHLGCFLAAYAALGLLAPLAVLLFKGGSSAFVRRHAVESLNFQISVLIYAAVCALLVFLLIGIPLLFALGAFYLVVVIVGSVKASRGQDYRYPLTFRFVS